MNSLLNKQIKFGKYDIGLPTFLWFSLTIIAVVLEVLRGENHYHNYFIYKYSFEHTIHFINLYKGTPLNEFDYFYGPVFSVIIAPFALLPNWLGCILWCVFNAWILHFAIDKINIPSQQKKAIILLCVVELMTSIHNVQINPMIAAWMILAFVFIEEENECLATLFIMLGFLTKLYGIVGLTFFLFSKHKLRFAVWFAIWAIVLFCLPMLISSPKYILQSYIDWINILQEKNTINITGGGGGMQDISFGGFIRRAFNMPDFKDIFLIIPFAIAYFLPLLKSKNYANPMFRLLFLALGLIAVVVLSSSAESPTYIIALVGCAIWFVTQKQTKLNLSLIIFVIVFTSLSATDLFPSYIKTHFIVRKSIKALPCVFIWLTILYQLNFNAQTLTTDTLIKQQ